VASLNVPAVATRRERHVLERAVRVIAEQAVKADALVDEATSGGGGCIP
jgi:hypothetical protein